MVSKIWTFQKIHFWWQLCFASIIKFFKVPKSGFEVKVVIRRKWILNFLRVQELVGCNSRKKDRAPAKSSPWRVFWLFPDPPNWCWWSLTPWAAPTQPWTPSLPWWRCFCRSRCTPQPAGSSRASKATCLQIFEPLTAAKHCFWLKLSKKS